MAHGAALFPPWAVARDLWVWAAVFWCGSSVARATVVEGRVPHESNFALFVTKFCYDFLPTGQESVGTVEVTLQRIDQHNRSGQLPGSGRLLFLIFDDEPRHWKKAQRSWETTSCDEKAGMASEVVPVFVTPGRTNNTFPVRIREHLRPRFWYFTLVGCNMQLAGPLRYRVHMANEVWGWQSEFSLDHMGLPFLYSAFFVLFGLAATATYHRSRQPRGSLGPPLKEHPYTQLILLAYTASVTSCALFLTHYLLFVRDGNGSKRLRFLAVVASIAANCTIFLIAMLSSVGWAITSFALPWRRCFLSMIGLVGGLSALSELHAQTMVDQSTKLYGYQSGPGVFALVVKIFTFCWFAHQTKLSYEEQQGERLRRFYKLLGLGITFWSLNVPVVVLLAFDLSPWVRYKIVVTVEVAARFAGSLLLTHLFCGPVTPIMMENTFPLGHTLSPQPEFSQLDDGHG